MNNPETAAAGEEAAQDTKQLTPREIVVALDRYIIGQGKAKRAVSIALRNRWRRQQVAPPLKDEIAPKNIIMIGPTGVGKTEIARRLASLAESPFLKVEASKFTEVGYVGRDVESMIRDLLEIAVGMVRQEERKIHEERAKELAEERLLDLLLPMASGYSRPLAPGGASRRAADVGVDSGSVAMVDADTSGTGQSTREKLRVMLWEGALDNREVELEISQQQMMPMVEVFSGSGMDDLQNNIRDTFSRMFSRKERRRKVRVPDALEQLGQEEMERLIDMDAVVKKAIQRSEDSGIVFIDEIDKIATRGGGGHGPEVSREGVQRDLLPIVEGATISTKYGSVRTDHILFIASGAFHLVKPSDLVPELQGRFPIRVELDALTEEDFYRILTEPKNALVRQYVALMSTEGLELVFTDDGIREMARLAAEVNRSTEDIGARRLHTIMERVLDTISFDAPEMTSQNICVDAAYVRAQLEEITKNEDLSRFVL